jgi:quercetin dioxygenase-like cupin family protein
MQLSRILGLLGLPTAVLIGACTPQHPTVSPAGAPRTSTNVVVPGDCMTMTRTGPPDAFGCYKAGAGQVGVAPATPLFWHLDVFATRALAEAARPPRGTVAEAHGRIWLFTIAEGEWRPAGGERVVRVGPLPLTPGRSYTAHYIDGVSPATARTAAHRHSGPEAWYVLEGISCVMTPHGARAAGPGETIIVPEGEPMILTGSGTTVRRSLAVIVYDASQKLTSPAPDLTPGESCPR